MSKLWTPFVNTIHLESFHQSTSNYLNDVIPPKRQMLLILGYLLKTRWQSSSFYKCNICLENAIFLESFHQFTSNLLNDVIPP